MSGSRSFARLLALFVFGSVSLVALPGARAAGFELTPASAKVNGRGGAVRAGIDTPMAMFFNPGRLASLGGYNVQISTHMHFSERCMTRVEVEENLTTGARTAGDPFPEVCNDAPVGIIPEFAFSAQPVDGLTLAIGVYAPPAGQRFSRYGEPETVTIEQDGMRVPSPLRYLLIESELLQAFPSIGFAYEVHPALRLGATFGWGITSIQFANAAFSRIKVDDTTLATADARIAANGVDEFVPRLTFGAHSRPSPNVPLELGLSFQWTQDIDIDDAKLDIETFNIQPDILPENPEGTVRGVRVQVPQAMQLGFGLRYFEELDEPVDDVGDRMSTERFDLEVDFLVTFTNAVDQFDVDLPDDAALEALGMEIPLPDDVQLEHRWRTQLSVYLGGDWNVVPGIFALRTGLSVDTDAVQDGYEQLDFTPFRRIGYHLGATVRVEETVDVSITYAHIFQPDERIRVDEARLRRTVGGDPDPGDDFLINAGTISSSYNLLVLGATAHF